MSWRRWTWAIAVLCVPSVLGCERQDPSLALILRGEDAVQAKRWDDAVDHFNEALRIAPNSARALSGRASAHEAIGDQAAAATDLQTALVVDSDAENIDLRLRLIELWLELGEPEQAADQLELVRSEIPEAESLLLLGRIQISQGDLQAAIASLRKAVEAEPDAASAWYYYGLALARANDYVGARSAFSEATRSETFQARAYWRRSIVQQQLGEPELAEEDRRKAAQLDPRLTFADSALGAQVLESLSGNSQSLEPSQKDSMP